MVAESISTGVRAAPELQRWPLLVQEMGLLWSQLDENPGNQAITSSCSPRKWHGSRSWGNNVVLEVVQAAEDAIQAVELSRALFAEGDVAGQEGAGDLDTFGSDEKGF